MAVSAVSRTSRAGCSAGKSSICFLISGDALNRIQSEPLALTAIDDCVRGLALIVPSLTPRQFAQLQFHWGKPPPAPDPNTCTNIKSSKLLLNRIALDMNAIGFKRCPEPVRAPGIHQKPLLTVADVHGYFKTKTHV